MDKIDDERELIFSASKKDFKVQFYRASGNGGQNRNKRDTACRITHITTGLTAYCEKYREQGKNKKEAFLKVAKLLSKHIKEEYIKKSFSILRETIRTYNESTNLVTDHITGEKFSYKKTIGKGDLTEVIESKSNKMTGENMRRGKI